MDAERIVIVGAGPAGLATARSYRACGGSASVTLVGEESFLPYERPPLTKGFLRGELDPAELCIEPREWFETNDVTVQLGARVSTIDPGRGAVTLAEHEQLEADAIVLATGSEPSRPELPGIRHPRVLTIRTLRDSVRIAGHISPDEQVLVIGTGFIGCEVAGSLALRGVKVTLIGEERLPQLARLGAEAACALAGWLTELGVMLLGGATVSSIEDGRVVALQDGRRLRGSCVVLGTGARPRGELAAEAALEMSDGAVVVDGAMCSGSAPAGRVLAVGDIACAYNARAERHLRVEHWGDALGHGEVAGRTLAGGDGCWDSVPGFWSTVGRRTFKYAAWGDGYEESRLVADGGGGFTVWYERGGATVGVLSHQRDDDYERGRELIGRGAPPP